MALKEVQECLAPFSNDKKTAALSVLCKYAIEVFSPRGVSVGRDKELMQALDEVHQGFNQLRAIYLMDEDSDNLKFLVDKFCKPRAGEVRERPPFPG